MKKVLWMFAAVLFLGGLPGTARVYAEVATGSSVTSLDQQKIQEEKQKIKTDAQTAKTEEKDLRAQIKQAKAAGDKQKVAELEKQLKTTHQANVQQRKEDKKGLQGAKKELRKDTKVARGTKR